MYLKMFKFKRTAFKFLDVLYKRNINQIMEPIHNLGNIPK